MQKMGHWSRRLFKAGVVVAASAAALVVLVVAITAVSQQSQANRQFQRETGKPCGYCHIPGNEPALGPRGIQYRNCGYSGACWGSGGGGGGGGGGRHGHDGCERGKIACSAWCDKYAEDVRGCKYTWSNGCTKPGGQRRCVWDRPPRE